MAKYPATSHHLSASARIVHSPVFESAVVKLLSDRALAAEVEESKKGLCPLLLLPIRRQTSPTTSGLCD
ncbi:hypothetical protein Pcac1_g19929 [Phytophthora cactorum]|nr:hypothetical protein Pcac1_g19929 [Phytophthora cactorum]